MFSQMKCKRGGQVKNENQEIKKINKTLESIRTFIIAEAQLTKQINLGIQEIIRELKALKGVAENGISIPSKREVS